MNLKTKLGISVLLVTLGVATRLLPHAWNVAPMAAMALFCGVYLGARYALIVPVVAMLAGDLFIGFYDYHLMLAVYGSFMIIGIIGVVIKKYKSFSTVIAASLTASVVFFGLTNGAVWVFSNWYTHDLAGLVNCFTMALPFLRYTVLGDLFYVSAFFGLYEVILMYAKQDKSLFRREKIAQVKQFFLNTIVVHRVR